MNSILLCKRTSEKILPQMSFKTMSHSNKGYLVILTVYIERSASESIYIFVVFLGSEQIPRRVICN